MQVQAVPCLSDNYAYLITSGKSAVIVDPSEAPPVIAAVERAGVTLSAIWLTHHHWDHVGGVADLLARQPQLPVYASTYDAEQKRIAGVTQALSAGAPLSFDGKAVQVMEVPGHTLGAIAFVVQGALFSGDTLFTAGCGRMFEGTPEVMQRSLAALRSLPPDTLLYPGHEYTVRNLEFALHVEPDNREASARLAKARERRAAAEACVPSTLREEHAPNPFLRWDAPAVIAFARANGAETTDAPAIFAAVRRAKDSF